MMSTTMQRVARGAKTPIAAAIDQVLARQATAAFSTATLTFPAGASLASDKRAVNVYPIQIRSLSLQALDMAAVRQIKAELMEVDAQGNGDGR